MRVPERLHVHRGFGMGFIKPDDKHSQVGLGLFYLGLTSITAIRLIWA